MLAALANCFLILSMFFLEVAETLNVTICYIKSAAYLRLRPRWFWVVRPGAAVSDDKG